MNKFWVITKEVYKKNVKSLGFIVMVLMPIVVVAVIAGIGYFVGQDSEQETPVAVLADENIQQVFEAEDWNFEIDESIETEEEADEALADEEIEAYISVQTQGSDIQAEVVHEDALSDSLPLITEALTNIQSTMRANQLGLSQEEVMGLSEAATVEERNVRIEEGQVSEGADDESTFAQQGGAYFVSIAILMFIMTYAGIIAEEVANEKGTRIMEIILSSATATNHFFGKLAGVVLILLTQITAYAVIAVGAFFYFRDNEFLQELLALIDMRAMLQELLGYTLIFFITGVLMYVVLAAFLGSLATKMEDVNKVVTPIAMLAVIGFYVGMFALSAPDNLFNVVFSYIPLFTPFVMPFRIAADSASQLGIWLSIVGTIAFSALISFVSLAFYRSNVLVYSDSNIFGTIKRSWSIMQSNRKAKKQNGSIS